MDVVLPLERQNEMKKSRFSDEEKIAILKEVRAGGTVVATCAKHNIGVQTYHGWKWMKRDGCGRWRKRTGV